MEKLKSRYGVYFSTSDSEEYYFDFNNIRYYFSSRFNEEKFKNNVADFVYENNEKFINRYGINFEMVDYFVLCYYKDVESRGYKIKDLITDELIVDSKDINVYFKANLERN